MMPPMPGLDFPRRHLAALQDIATRLIDSRKIGTDRVTVAHELLAGFFDTSVRSGLDGLLAELEQTFPGLDISDRTSFFDGPLTPAVVAQLASFDLDDGSPRSAKPRKLVDSVVVALRLNLVDEVDRTLALDGSVRAAAVAAIAKVIDVELALPRLRDSIINHARTRCEERYFVAYEKLSAQLDERGMRFMKQLKLPVDAVHAVEGVLFEARKAVIGAAARSAIDSAKAVIAAASADAAERIDAPITLRLTPRDCAVARVCDPRLPKLPAVVAGTLLESLSELAALSWRVPERAARPYAANQTFNVGELIEHPKFGLGTVTACAMQRVDVEFADGNHTLVHAGVRQR